jgi:cation:H+ antiporter
MFAVGVGLLVLGADRLVVGASSLARRLGVSTVVIGLTVVALGTSTPELFVSCVSAAQGKADIAVGNVVGSNIVNLLVILGLTALIMPLMVSRRLLLFDSMVMAVLALVVGGMCLDGSVSRIDGVLLLIGLCVYLWVSIKMSAPVSAEPEVKKSTNSATSVLWVVLGLAALIVGSQFVLTASVAVAKANGLSELFIGLTIVAIGTSLPEIAASLMAAWRGDAEMSVANIVGSNILNILAILGMSAVVAPNGLAVPDAARLFDVPVMIIVSVAVIPLFWTHSRITRLDSIVLSAGYCLYVTSLWVDWNNSEAFNMLLWAAVGYGLFAATVIYCGVRATLSKPKEVVVAD